MASETGIENSSKNNDVIEYVSDAWVFGFILFCLAVLLFSFYMGYLFGSA